MNCEKECIPERVQDKQIHDYIDTLLQVGKEERNSLSDIPGNDSVCLDLMDDGQRAQVLGERYVSMLLKRSGKKVAIMKEGEGYAIKAQGAGSNRPMRYDVQVERLQQSPYIGIETFRTINGEKVASGINDTIADQYVVLVCGIPGVFQIPTKNLKAILKDHCLEEVTIPYDNGCYYVSVIERQLLLDNALHLTA